MTPLSYTASPVARVPRRTSNLAYKAAFSNQTLRSEGSEQCCVPPDIFANSTARYPFHITDLRLRLQSTSDTRSSRPDTRPVTSQARSGFHQVTRFHLLLRFTENELWPPSRKSASPVSTTTLSTGPSPARGTCTADVQGRIAPQDQDPRSRYDAASCVQFTRKSARGREQDPEGNERVTGGFQRSQA